MCALGWNKYREHISLLVILCIIVYVTNKTHLSLIIIIINAKFNHPKIKNLIKSNHNQFAHNVNIHYPLFILWLCGKILSRLFICRRINETYSPDIFKTKQKDLHGETKGDLPELLAFCDSQYLRSEKWAPNKNY